MNGSDWPEGNAVHNNSTLDLTNEEPDDPYRPSNSSAHRLPPHEQHHPNQGGPVYNPPTHVNHPTFPHAVPQLAGRQGYTPTSIAQQYSPSHQTHSYAAKRPPLYDQSIRFAATGRGPQFGAQNHSSRDRFPQEHQQQAPSPFDHAVASTPSLFLPRQTKVSSGPAGAYPSFQSRHAGHAPAIAPYPSPSAPPYSQPGQYAPRPPHPPPHPHSHSQPRPYYQPQQQHQRQPPHPPPPPPAQQQHAPTPTQQSQHQPASPPARKRVLPPGFNPTPEPEQPHQPQAHHPAADVDLTREHSPFAPLHDQDDMQPRRRDPVPFAPRDPEQDRARSSRDAAVQYRAGGAGWQSSNFDDDDDGGAPPPAGSSARKGGAAGKARAEFSGATKIQVKGKGKAKEGGGVTYTGGEVAAMAKLSFKKLGHSTAPTAVSSAAFHGPSPSHTSNAAAGPSRARIIEQDDPATAQEMAGAARRQQVASKAAGAKKANGAGGARGGKKGKKKETEVLELLSSGEDDDEDEIEDADGASGEGEGSGSGSGSGAGTGARGAPPVMVIKGRAAQAQAQQLVEPSSEDELAIRSDPRRHAQREKERRASAVAEDHVPGGLVFQRKAAYEAIDAKAKTSVAGSLKGKTKPRTDGGPTDGGEYDAPAPPRRIPRAAAEAVANGNAKAKGKGKGKAVDNLSALGGVYAVPIEAYLVSRRRILSDYASNKITLTLNNRGNYRTHNLTIRRSARGGEPVSEHEIKASDVRAVNYWDALSPDTIPFIELKMDLSKPNGKKLYNAISNEVELVADIDQTIILPFAEKPSSDWKETPRTHVDMIFNTCVLGWNGTEVPSVRAKTLKEIYDKCKAEADDVAQLALDRKTKSKKRESNQPTLSFATVPGSRVQADDTGNLVPLAPPGTAPRRSSRPSTSAFASESRQDAAAPQPAYKSPSPQPYAPDEVVLEYPLGEPGAVSVTWADTRRLRDEEFLNDTLIEFGLKRIMKGIEERDVSLPEGEKLAPQIHIFNSFFYKQFSSKKDKKAKLDPYNLVEKWTKRVNLFEKKYIVVPINEYMHWYLAIIVNPAAILKPPPAPPPPAEPRKSGRKRQSTTDSDFISYGSPTGSPEIVSKHFSGAGRSLREDAAEQRAEEDEQAAQDEQEEREVQDKVQRELRAQEARHEEEDSVRAEVERVKVQRRERAPTPRPAAVEQMQIDSDDEATAPLGGGKRADDAPAAEEDDDMLASSESPPPAAQPSHSNDARLSSVDAMDEDDDDEVTRVRPEVEGGGPRKSVAAASQGKHTRFDNNDANPAEDAVIVDSDDPSQSSQPSPPLPAKQGEPRQRLRRGSKKDEPAPASINQAINLADDDDDEEDSLPAPETLGPAAAAASAPMEKGASTTSTSTSASSATTATATATSVEPSFRAPPPQTKYGSSSSRTRKSVAPMAFAPMDPEPGRQEELARQREEEEAQRARDGGDSTGAEGVQGKGGGVDDCWVLTFDSLGPAHAPVATRLKEYLGREAESKLGIPRQKTSWEQSPHTKVDVPLQPNSCDCGLYLLHFVETFFKNPVHYLNVIVAASGRNAPRSDKGKEQAQAEASQTWGGEDAKQKRKAMRDDVQALMADYQAKIGPLREKEAQERAERKKQRRLEREQKADAEAAQRADGYEAEERQRLEAPGPVPEQPAAPAAPAVPAAPAAPAADTEMRSPPPAEETRPASPPPAAQAPAEQQLAPATPPRVASKRNRGGKAKKEVETVELSDGESSTMGSPVKAQPALAVASTTPTAPAPSQPLAPTPLPQEAPERTKAKPQRQRAVYSSGVSPTTATGAVANVYEQPAHATCSHASQNPEKPFTLATTPTRATAAAVAASMPAPAHAHKDAPQSLDAGVIDDASPDPPRKRAKMSHGDKPSGLIAALGPSPLPGGIESYESSDDEGGHGEGEGGAAISQELFAPEREDQPPPSAQAQAPIPSMGRVVRPKSNATETLTID